jgi:phage-related protein
MMPERGRCANGSWSLLPEDRKAIGEDIATLEFCWPIGKPKCSPIKGIKGLYEIRSNISSGRIARVFFVLVGSQMVLLHGFVKKTQKTPDKELELAATRMKKVRRHE